MLAEKHDAIFSSHHAVWSDKGTGRRVLLDYPCLQAA